MKNRRGKKFNLLLLVILGLTVGFALLSTTLKINGTAGIKSNTWSIHWVKNSITETTGSVEAITKADTTDSANQVIEFAAEFELPGDYYEFTVDAVNEGSIDGIIADDTDIKKGVYNLSDQLLTTTPENFKYTVVYADDDNDSTNDVAPAKGDILKVGESKKYKVRVEFDSEAEGLPKTAESYKFKFEVVYTQYKEPAPTTKKYLLQNDATAIEKGNEVCIDTECFYIIDTNETTTKLLAKYNLYVGVNYVSGDYNLIEENDPDFCLQSIKTIPNETENKYDGLVPFSTKDYWWDFSGSDPVMKEKYRPDGYTDANPYNEGYPHIYDEDYDAAPVFKFSNTYGYCSDNSDYSIAYYLKKYKTILTTKGAIYNKVRIADVAEGAAFANDSANFNVPFTFSWVDGDYYSSVYMLGTREGDYYVSTISSYSATDPGLAGIGIRPLLEVPTSSIKID